MVVTDKDKKQAIKLAKKSLMLFNKTPKAYKGEIEEVSDWLMKHDNSKNNSVDKQ